MKLKMITMALITAITCSIALVPIHAQENPMHNDQGAGVVSKYNVHVVTYDKHESVPSGYNVNVQEEKYGGEYEIYKGNETTPLRTISVDEHNYGPDGSGPKNRYADFVGLEPGVYRIMQKRAPEGLVHNAGVKRVVISNNDTNQRDVIVNFVSEKGPKTSKVVVNIENLSNGRASEYAYLGTLEMVNILDANDKHIGKKLPNGNYVFDNIQSGVYHLAFVKDSRDQTVYGEPTEVYITKKTGETEYINLVIEYNLLKLVITNSLTGEPVANAEVMLTSHRDPTDVIKANTSDMGVIMFADLLETSYSIALLNPDLNDIETRKFISQGIMMDENDKGTINLKVKTQTESTKPTDSSEPDKPLNTLKPQITPTPPTKPTINTQPTVIEEEGFDKPMVGGVAEVADNGLAGLGGLSTVDALNVENASTNTVGNHHNDLEQQTLGDQKTPTDAAEGMLARPDNKYEVTTMQEPVPSLKVNNGDSGSDASTVENSNVAAETKPEAKQAATLPQTGDSNMFIKLGLLAVGLGCLCTLYAFQKKYKN